METLISFFQRLFTSSPVQKIDQLTESAIKKIWDTKFMQDVNAKLNLGLITENQWLQQFNSRYREVYDPGFLQKVKQLSADYPAKFFYYSAINIFLISMLFLQFLKEKKSAFKVLNFFLQVFLLIPLANLVSLFIFNYTVLSYKYCKQFLGYL